MTKRSRKTPQMVSVNRIFLVIGILGVLAMVAYVYWDRNHPPAQNINSQQLTP